MSKQLWRVYHSLNQDPVIRLHGAYIEEKNRERRRRIMDRLVVRLTSYSQNKGVLFGFQDYVAHQVLQDENLFTSASEKGSALDPTLLRLVLADLKRVRSVMNTPWRRENGPTADFLAGPCRFCGYPTIP